MFMPSSTPNQIKSMPSFLGDGGQQRNDDEGDLEEVDKEGDNEDEHVDRDEETPFTAGQIKEQVFHPLVTFNTIEGEGEDATSDEDEEHKAGEARRGVERIAHGGKAEAAFCQRKKDSTCGSHGTAFGGRGEANEDCPQHEEDEGQWRHHHKDNLLGEAVEAAKFG